MKKNLSLLIAAALLLTSSIGSAKNPKADQLLNPFTMKQKQSNASLCRNDQNDFNFLPERILTTIHRPLKQIVSHWDNINNTWIYHDSSRFSYTSYGSMTQEINYDQAGNYNRKITNTYNSAGRQTQYLMQYWDGTTWTNSYKNTYWYNAGGKITQTIYQNWDLTLVSWINNSKSNSTYNSNGDITTYISQRWDNTASIWKNYYRNTYSYNGNNQYAEGIFQTWNDVAAAWDNSNKFDYTYSTNGECTGGTDFSWDGSSWQNNYMITNVIWYNWSGSLFNQENKLTSYLEQSWDSSAWVNHFNYNMSYDAFGNSTMNTEFIWQNNAWAINYESNDVYTYDVNNNIMQDIWQRWNSITQTLVNDTKYDYNEYMVFTGVQEINSNANEISLFPNPSHASATVRVNPFLHMDEIVVYNLLGKLIMTIESDNNTSEIKIDRSDLPSGIYFIHAEAKHVKITNVIKWVVE